MDQSIKAGIVGIVLAVFIEGSVPIQPPLDFLPVFLVVIFAIFIFRLNTLKDGLVVAFMTYVFTNGILGTIEFAYYYNQTYSIAPVTSYIVVDPIITAISAFIAAYVGVWLAKKRPVPPQKTQPQSTDIPRDLQTV
jgi:uncharacterized membrane protein YfcA